MSVVGGLVSVRSDTLERWGYVASGTCCCPVSMMTEPLASRPARLDVFDRLSETSPPIVRPNGDIAKCMDDVREGFQVRGGSCPLIRGRQGRKVLQECRSLQHGIGRLTPVQRVCTLAAPGEHRLHFRTAPGTARP